MPLEPVAAAQNGHLDDAAFLDCIRTTRPYAYGLVAGLAGRASADGLADNRVSPVR